MPRSKRLQRQLRAQPKAPPEPRETVVPGYEREQAAAQHELETAWYEDPSYADREIDMEALRYLEWWEREEGMLTL